MLTISWTRASEFKVQGAVILPTQRASLVRTEASADADDWTDLTGVYERVRHGFRNGQLSAPARKVLLDWCNERGLFGLLCEELTEIRFPATYELRTILDPFDPEDNCEQPIPLPVQRIFRRDGVLWGQFEQNDQAPSSYTPPDLDATLVDAEIPEAPPSDDWEQLGKIVNEPYWQSAATIRSLGSRKVERRNLEDLDIFFPRLKGADLIPLPQSEAFWLGYSEPIREWLRAAQWMLDSLRAAKNRSMQRLERLASNGQLRWTGKRNQRGQIRWEAGSVMAAMAFSALVQTQKGRILTCGNCKGPFVARSAGQRKWCSTRCFQTGNKRRQRKRNKTSTK